MKDDLSGGPRPGSKHKNGIRRAYKLGILASLAAAGICMFFVGGSRAPESRAGVVKKDALYEYHDTNGNGTIDFFGGRDLEFFNRAEGLLGNSFGYGWEVRVKARGIDMGLYRSQVSAEGAPDNIWVSYMFHSDTLKNLITGEERPLTPEMKRMIKDHYRENYPWNAKNGIVLIERAGGIERYYSRIMYRSNGEIDVEKTLSSGPDFTRDAER
jgi:hypothetical protein